jgi:hypothetical protein
MHRRGPEAVAWLQGWDGAPSMNDEWDGGVAIVGQALSAGLITYGKVVRRFCELIALDVRTILDAGWSELRAAPNAPHAAIEEAASKGYRSHVATLRAIAGLSRLSVLLYVSELDKLRGERAVPSDLGPN